MLIQAEVQRTFTTGHPTDVTCSSSRDSPCSLNSHAVPTFPSCTCRRQGRMTSRGQCSRRSDGSLLGCRPLQGLWDPLQLLQCCRTNFMVSGYWYYWNSGVFGRSSIAKDNPTPSDSLGGVSQAGNHLAWGVSRDPGGGESTQLRHTESPLHHARKFSATFYDKLLSANVIKINRQVPKLIPYIFPTLLLRS